MCREEEAKSTVSFYTKKPLTSSNIEPWEMSFFTSTFAKILISCQDVIKREAVQLVYGWMVQSFASLLFQQMPGIQLVSAVQCNCMSV